MAVVSFPDSSASPWTNPDNGITYEYVNGAWRAIGGPSAVLDDTYVNVAGDHMSGSLTIGDKAEKITLDAVNGSASFVSATVGGTDEIVLEGTGDASFAGDVQMASLNGGQLAGFRNHLINGDFRIYQRGDIVTDGQFGVDRWCKPASGSTISEWRKRTNNNVPECPVAVEITSTGVDFDYIFQPIELPFTGNAGPFGVGSVWTLSFWANVDMIANWNQNHCLQFTNGSSGGAAVNAVSGGNSAPVVIETSSTDSSWKRYAIQNLVINTAPDPANRSLDVRIKLPTSAVRIGQCQLEPGPVATPFEHRPYGAELSLCQRYFQRIDVGGLGPVSRSIDVDGRSMSTTIPSNNQMRTTPSFKNASTANSNDIELQRHSGDTARVFTVTGCNNNGPFAITFPGDTADNHLYIFRGTGRNVFHFDAEL